MGLCLRLLDGPADKGHGHVFKKDTVRIVMYGLNQDWML
jgi:hypothetical protein